MKKVFLTMLGVFAMALMFSLNYQDNALVESNAFADGACCSENNSICGLGGEAYLHYYFDGDGSCVEPDPDIPVRDLRLVP